MLQKCQGQKRQRMTEELSKIRRVQRDMKIKTETQDPRQDPGLERGHWWEKMKFK